MMIENEWRMIHGNSSLLAVRSKGQSYRHIFQCEKQSTTEHNTYVDKLCTGPIRLNNKIIIIIWWLAMLKKTQNHRECSRNLFWANESSSSMCSDSCFVLRIICRIRSMSGSSWHRVLTSHDHSEQKIKLISWHISDNVLDALEPPADKFIRIFVLCRMNDQR